jgi:hypothetical protein
LRDPQVTIVNRAAYALGIMGNENAFPRLAEALVTSDEFEEWTLSPGAVVKGRRTGDRENPEVLRALVLLSGENFGYDKAAWRRWYAARRMPSDRNQPDDRRSLPINSSSPTPVRRAKPSDFPDPSSTTRATRNLR